MVKLATQAGGRAVREVVFLPSASPTQMRTKLQLREALLKVEAKHGTPAIHFTFRCCVQNQGVWSLVGGPQSGRGVQHATGSDHRGSWWG